jgi:hypothetical protein
LKKTGTDPVPAIVICDRRPRKPDSEGLQEACQHGLANVQLCAFHAASGIWRMNSTFFGGGF